MFSLIQPKEVEEILSWLGPFKHVLNLKAKGFKCGLKCFTKIRSVLICRFSIYQL